MTSMIDSVAVALECQMAKTPIQTVSLSEWHRLLARAAIEAMQEPTEEMVDAVNRKERQLLQGPAGARLHYSVAFRAMIDAALETGK